jgi:uncharacterized membrane protein YdjX (TVP38/TMEM64 family)
VSTRSAVWPKALLALLFVGALVAYFAVDASRFANLDALKASRDALLAFGERHYTAALAIAFAAYVAAVALSLPVATLLSLAAGFVFGRWIGTALVVVAATVGATIVFLAARYVFADAARRRLGARGRSIDAGFTRNAFSWLLFLRLVPLFPFFLVNLAAALTTVGARTYALATLVGIVPGAFVYANLGEALAGIESTRGLLSARTLFALTLLGVLALTPIVVRKWKARSTAGAS